MTALQELRDNGFTIINNVIPVSECDKYTTLYKVWLNRFGDNPPFQRHSIVQQYHVGHFEQTWKARLQTKQFFADVWGTEKLLTSTDGVAMGKPPELGGLVNNQSWLHCDQGAQRQGLHCYQGAVYLEQTTETDWCFRAMKRSHLFHEEFFNTFPKAKGKSRRSDLYRLLPEELAWYESKGSMLMKVAVPKGGLLLWDSRTIHDNSPPVEGRPNPDRWRFVVFVSMTPAHWATEADLHIKRNAYKDMSTTSHNSSQGIKAFPTDPVRGNKRMFTINKLPKVAETPEVRRLCGVLPYDFEDDKPNGPPAPIWERDN